MTEEHKELRSSVYKPDLGRLQSAKWCAAHLAAYVRERGQTLRIKRRVKHDMVIIKYALPGLNKHLLMIKRPKDPVIELFIKRNKQRDPLLSMKMDISSPDHKKQLNAFLDDFVSGVLKLDPKVASSSLGPDIDSSDLCLVQ